MRRVAHVLTVAAIVFTATACTRDEPAQAPAPPAPPPADPQVSNLQLGAGASDSSEELQTKQEFAPGEPIHLSMSVEGAMEEPFVTTYWYGPSGRALAYETKELPKDAQRVHFVQDNTFDWPPGQYRAEVWIGDEKADEQLFEIVTG